eukprot:gb/GECG01000630.1/.p1 GENE.gb/GECG01000630.1/~~gb/GECG01000630.1/.p1  ORF type:complete len:224 (+),score=7.86 gb/GECG01000630.1/:1-672(+)
MPSKNLEAFAYRLLERPADSKRRTRGDRPITLGRLCCKCMLSIFCVGPALGMYIAMLLPSIALAEAHIKRNDGRVELNYDMNLWKWCHRKTPAPAAPAGNVPSWQCQGVSEDPYYDEYEHLLKGLRAVIIFGLLFELGYMIAANSTKSNFFMSRVKVCMSMVFLSLICMILIVVLQKKIASKTPYGYSNLYWILGIVWVGTRAFYYLFAICNIFVSGLAEVEV